MMTWTANGSGGGAGTIAGTMPRSSMFSFLAAGGKAISALGPPFATLDGTFTIDQQPLIAA
jgi:hypothetical protein